jgi:predicted secreted protein
MSSAIFGKGTKFQVEDAPAAGTYTTIAEVKTISGPSFEAEEIDVTNHDSTGDFREFIRGLIDPGEITFEINYQPDDALHQQLFDDLAAGTKRNYKMLFDQMTPTKYQMDFEAFIRSMPITAPVDNVLSANVTVRVTGQPVITSV